MKRLPDKGKQGVSSDKPTHAQSRLTRGQKIGFYSLSLGACFLSGYALWQLGQTVSQPAPAVATSLSALSGQAAASKPASLSAQGGQTHAPLTAFDAFFPKNNRALSPQKKAPESSLKLTLYGLRSGQGGIQGAGQGSVILKVQGDKQKLVKTGDMITAGVRLLAVYDNHIEISRKGRREAITYRESRSGLNGQPLSSKALGTSGVQKKSENKSVSADRMDLLKILDLTAFRQGHRIKGFQLGREADQSLASVLQLQTDDILLAVNGESLTSFERAQELSVKLLPNTSALDLVTKTISITLERRGEKMTFNVPVMVLVSHFGLQKISGTTGDQDSRLYKVTKG